jgi:hypothetical protein
MTGFERAEADGPLDELDDEILSGIRQYWSSVDPMPAELIDQILFAIDLDTIDVSVLRTTETHLVAAARGDEHTRVITFAGDDLNLMVTVGDNQDGTNRIDGWLAPAAGHRVQLRTAGGPMSTTADASGRFSLARVPSGTVQFVFLVGDGSKLVATRSIAL